MFSRGTEVSRKLRFLAAYSLFFFPPVFTSPGGIQKSKESNESPLRVNISPEMTVAAQHYPGNILLIGPIFGTIVKPDFSERSKTVLPVRLSDVWK